MPRPRPPHLHREANRHGTVVWYVRVGKGSRIRIKAEYGTPEFVAAYQSAVRGERPRGPGKAARGTLGWLVRSLPADHRLDRPGKIHTLQARKDHDAGAGDRRTRTDISDQ